MIAKFIKRIFKKKKRTGLDMTSSINLMREIIAKSCKNQLETLVRETIEYHSSNLDKISVILDDGEVVSGTIVAECPGYIVVEFFGHFSYIKIEEKYSKKKVEKIQYEILNELISDYKHKIGK